MFGVVASTESKSEILVTERKLQCPNCSQPMQLKRIQQNNEQKSFAHYECKPCGIGISDAVEVKDPGDRTLQ